MAGRPPKLPREKSKPTEELESLCYEYIRRLERGDETEDQVEQIRTFICDKYPEVIGGGGR